MKFRLPVAAAAAVLAAMALAPAAQAAGPQIRVHDMASREYHKSCSDVPPYPCGTHSLTMTIMIQALGINRPITVGYAIDDVTATRGADYQAAATGTVTIQPNAPQAYVFVETVVDSVTEPRETFRVRLTSASVHADLSDTGIGSIDDGGTIPTDCDLNRPDADTVSMTCTSRPPDQRWRHTAVCNVWPVQRVYGDIVTGNGTSTARCTTFEYSYSHFTVLQ